MKVISKILLIIFLLTLILLTCTSCLGLSKEQKGVEGYIYRKRYFPEMTVFYKDENNLTCSRREPAKYIFTLVHYNEGGEIVYSTSLFVDEETYTQYEIGDYYKYVR